jgi:hypothetical protein
MDAGFAVYGRDRVSDVRSVLEMQGDVYGSGSGTGRKAAGMRGKRATMFRQGMSESSEKEVFQTEDKTGFRISKGKTYEYTGSHPVNCKGCLYRVVGFGPQVPSYQEQVFVIALNGPDAGLMFCTTPQNFSIRYKLVEEEPAAVPAEPEKEIYQYKGEEWRSGV